MGIFRHLDPNPPNLYEGPKKKERPLNELSRALERDAYRESRKTTLRKLLTEKGFDWDRGVIVWEPRSYIDDKIVVWRPKRMVIPPRLINNKHPILDKVFVNGHRFINFVAKDDKAVYFAHQARGEYEVVKIYQDLNKYANGEAEMPDYRY